MSDPTSSPREATRRGFAEIDGGELYYETCGSGPVVALLHGFSFDRRMWDPQFELLSREFRVVRYDLRGYGKSSIPGRPYSHAEDLLVLMKSLGIEKAHVVGLSLGGAVAVEFAIRNPERTRSIVASSAALPGFPRREGSSGALLARIAAQQGIEAAKEFWLSDQSLLAYSLRKHDAALLVRQMVQDYSGWHLSSADPAEVPQVIENLDKVSARTLVLIGDHDQEEFQQMAEFLYRNIRGARNQVIEGAAHLCNMEQPEAFNRAVISFLLAGN